MSQGPVGGAEPIPSAEPRPVERGRPRPDRRLCLSLRFTQNLSAFRREVNDSMKNSTYGVNSNDMMS